VKATDGSGDAEPQELPVLWPIHAAARFLSISKFTLYYWATTRRIPHYRIGRKVMFAKADLVDWLRAHRVERIEPAVTRRDTPME
jgi:excisionase family DNA binding protein